MGDHELLMLQQFGAAKPLPFPPEAAADTTTQPRRPSRWLGWGLAALALAGCLLLVSPAEVAAALRPEPLLVAGAVLQPVVDEVVRVLAGAGVPEAGHVLGVGHPAGP